MKNAFTVFILSILLFFLLLGCNKISQNNANDSNEFNFDGNSYLNIPYKSIPNTQTNLLSLDIYIPKNAEGKKLPVILYVHGGGWAVGDKANKNSYEYKAPHFTSNGFIYVSANYRLSPEVMYPTYSEDIASAIKFLIENADKYSIDENHISLMGHSAGGQIISSVSTDEKYLTNEGLLLSTLSCAISLDTEGYDISDRAPDGVEVYNAAFGYDPLVWADASPINHVESDKGIPSFFIVTRGSKARVAQAKSFQEKLTEANVFVKLIETPTLDHDGVNESTGNPKDTLITPELDAFLETNCK